MKDLKYEYEKFDKNFGRHLIEVTLTLAVIFVLFVAITLFPAQLGGEVIFLRQNLSGTFTGQVVDYVTKMPIPNATVMIFADDTPFHLIITTFTNNIGIYTTPNITLHESYAYLVTSCKGYYTEPSTWNNERIEKSGNNTYFIEPVKLFRISTSQTIHAINRNGDIIKNNGTLNIFVDSSTFYPSNEYLTFTLFNTDKDSSLGAPYFNLKAAIFETDNNFRIMFMQGSSTFQYAEFDLPFNEMSISVSVPIEYALGNYTSHLKFRITENFDDYLYPQPSIFAEFEFDIKVTYIW